MGYARFLARDYKGALSVPFSSRLWSKDFDPPLKNGGIWGAAVFRCAVLLSACDLLATCSGKCACKAQVFAVDQGFDIQATHSVRDH